MAGIINLQDSFLNSVRKDRTNITLFLNNGYKLTGLVTGFDNYVIIIETDKGQQMIYKHAITSIMPLKRVKLNISETEEQ
ncbi:MAG TPA: RNA chaperone Hfq [Sedimentibacter sp.]|jgi:host factor-I protein|nr:RNA chaperone Hfq [Sedimentibacter sp.]HHZ00838.1 RNA chaperone Hfq [Tissierellia bacterium]HOK48984.1 RNA chaperone Hfq [Sedimentibacter sp.]HOW22081.1 RNA chaperone Hfq [Sedimentibacter sp.]HRC79903.1 RNA chaperone Hfq [Sedimentibacter sp.]